MTHITCNQCGAPNRPVARFCTKCGNPLATPPAAPLQVRTLKRGQLLQNRYRIEGELGRGGFGAVYQAWDSNLNRWCAIKENRETTSQAQRHFLREATVLANISHPNLPRVVDHFFIPHQGQYLVMDFVEGEDLGAITGRQGILPLGQCLRWIVQVADALEYLHALSPPVIHRDIKPANIRITPQEKAMLVDFGLVKVFDQSISSTIGAQAYTPGYAPPEHYSMAATDVRTDVYGLAATLFRMLSGIEPPESIRRPASSAIPDLSGLNPAVPSHLSRAVEKGMALEPIQRYQTISEFKSALLSSPPVRMPIQAVAGPTPVPIPRTILAESVSPPMVPPRRGTVMMSQVAESIPRSNPLWMVIVGSLGAVLVGIIVIGVIGWLLLSNQASRYARLTTTAQFDATSSESSRSISATAQFQSTQTASFQTATAQAAASLTAGAGDISTARAQATERAMATESFFSALLSRRKLISGPQNGSLNHKPSDEQISAEWIEVNLEDVVVDASFLNPYDASEGLWAHGIVLQMFTGDQYRLVIDSNLNWQYTQMYQGEKQIDSKLADGKLLGLQTGDNDANQMRFIKDGSQGWLFVNGQLVASFDLSAWSDLKWIAAATGLWIDSEKEREIHPLPGIHHLVVAIR